MIISYVGIYFAGELLLVHFKGILFAFDLSSVRCSCMAETQYRTGAGSEE